MVKKTKTLIKTKRNKTEVTNNFPATFGPIVGASRVLKKERDAKNKGRHVSKQTFANGSCIFPSVPPLSVVKENGMNCVQVQRSR